VDGGHDVRQRPVGDREWLGDLAARERLDDGVVDRDGVVVQAGRGLFGHLVPNSEVVGHSVTPAA
jgi:hypothetical protein